MSNYMRNVGVKNYENQTTTPQLIANNMSGCFFLKHGVELYRVFDLNSYSTKNYKSRLCWDMFAMCIDTYCMNTVMPCIGVCSYVF